MVLAVGYRGSRQPAADLTQRLTDQVSTALAEPAWGVSGLRVRVHASEDGRGPIVGQVNFTALGWALRAQAACDRPEELAGLLVARISRQMVVPSSGVWVRPWPDPLARVTPVPAGPAVISRRKPVRLRPMTSMKAILALDALDHQAHLFRDPQTGAEAVVYRDGPCGYRMICTERADFSRSAPAVLVTDLFPPPRLSLSSALTRLTAFGETHLFFTDASTGRGGLLYARYAGGYGLIEAVA